MARHNYAKRCFAKRERRPRRDMAGETTPGGKPRCDVCQRAVFAHQISETANGRFRHRSCWPALKEKWEELQAFLKTKPSPPDMAHALQQYEDYKTLLEEQEREQKERARMSGEDRPEAIFLVSVRLAPTHVNFE
jgi:hypothetical protein